MNMHTNQTTLTHPQNGEKQASGREEAENGQPSGNNQRSGNDQAWRTLTLQRPVEGHEGLIKKLYFNDPTAQVWMDYGYPVDTWVEEERGRERRSHVPNARAIAAYIADMTELDEVQVSLMSVPDINATIPIISTMIQSLGKSVTTLES